LRLELKRALIGMAPSTYNATVEIACKIEGEDLEQTRQRNKRGFKPPAPKRPE
jgi:hypothetical protein